MAAFFIYPCNERGAPSNTKPVAADDIDARQNYRVMPVEGNVSDHPLGGSHLAFSGNRVWLYGKNTENDAVPWGLERKSDGSFQIVNHWRAFSGERRAGMKIGTEQGRAEVVLKRSCAESWCLTPNITGLRNSYKILLVGAGERADTDSFLVEKAPCILFLSDGKAITTAYTSPPALETATETSMSGWDAGTHDLTMASNSFGGDWKKWAITRPLPDRLTAFQVRFQWKDQGWGNRKGTFSLRVRRKGGIVAKFAQNIGGTAPHSWGSVNVKFDKQGFGSTDGDDFFIYSFSDTGMPTPKACEPLRAGQIRTGELYRVVPCKDTVRGKPYKAPHLAFSGHEVRLYPQNTENDAVPWKLQRQSDGSFQIVNQWRATSGESRAGMRIGVNDERKLVLVDGSCCRDSWRLVPGKAGAGAYKIVHVTRGAPCVQILPSGVVVTGAYYSYSPLLTHTNAGDVLELWCLAGTGGGHSLSVRNFKMRYFTGFSGQAALVTLLLTLESCCHGLANQWTIYHIAGFVGGKRDWLA